MHNDYLNTRDEQRDKAKSAIITVVVWGAILLFIFMYTVSQEIDKPREVVTTMLVNFGDNNNGSGEEEPAPEEGSLAGETIMIPEETTPIEEAIKVEPVAEVKKEQPKRAIEKDKVVLGNNKEIKASKTTDKVEDKSTDTKKTSANKNTSAVKNTTKGSSASSTANAKEGKGDGKGNAAIGSFLEGRGKAKGGQGDGSGAGNAGDPLGGTGNGDSKIGIDRNLISYIPGTMGRGGAQPEHNCTASGTITIAYTVDKSGNVVSARRQNGISDPCVVSTSTSWVKKYVKAEKASTSSSGSYKIIF